MIAYISEMLLPMVILFIVGAGVYKKVPIFESFLRGAKDGMQVVVGILPTLLGLMVAIGVVRVSGVLELFAWALGGVMGMLHFPSELVPLVVIKMISSSAATGLLLDVYKTYGVDSKIGEMASILMSCSETIFYTLAVYFAAAKVKNTRYTIAGALTATFAGIVATVLLVG